MERQDPLQDPERDQGHGRQGTGRRVPEAVRLRLHDERQPLDLPDAGPALARPPRSVAARAREELEGVGEVHVAAGEDHADALAARRRACRGSAAASPSTPVGSTTSFMRSQHEAHRAHEVGVGDRRPCRPRDSRTSGNVSVPSDGVRAPSAIVRGLLTVCSVPVRNERVASSPSSGSTPTTRQPGASGLRGERRSRQQPAAAAAARAAGRARPPPRGARGPRCPGPRSRRRGRRAGSRASPPSRRSRSRELLALLASPDRRRRPERRSPRSPARLAAGASLGITIVAARAEQAATQRHGLARGCPRSRRARRGAASSSVSRASAL